MDHVRLGRRASTRRPSACARPAAASRSSRSTRSTAAGSRSSPTPPGAHLGIWQVGEHRGAEVVNEPGAWSWSQLLTTDPDGAKPFYGAVFGWETDAFGDFTMWRVPGFVGGEPEQPVPRDVVAGMERLPADGGRPHWQIDFWVDDVDATIATAEELGGRVVAGPYDSEIARHAVIADPAGAVFSVTRITIGG